MQPDFEVIRWRLLFAAMMALFFVVGGVRYTVGKVKAYRSARSSSSASLQATGSVAPVSMLTQIEQARQARLGRE